MPEVSIGKRSGFSDKKEDETPLRTAPMTDRVLLLTKANGLYYFL